MYYALNNERVKDPLFNFKITTSSDREAAKPVIAGHYKADFFLMGMQIFGMLTKKDFISVEVLLNGHVLRNIRLENHIGFSTFQMIIRRPSLCLSPINQY